MPREISLESMCENFSRTVGFTVDPDENPYMKRWVDDDPTFDLIAAIEEIDNRYLSLIGDD